MTMSLKNKLAKAAAAKKKVKAKEVDTVPRPTPRKTSPPRTPQPKNPKERRKAQRVDEVIALFRGDGSVVPGAEWVIAGQGVAHPLGALDEVLNGVPRTREGLREFFLSTALKGVLFDQGPGKPVGVLREDVGL